MLSIHTLNPLHISMWWAQLAALCAGAAVPLAPQRALISVGSPRTRSTAPLGSIKHTQAQRQASADQLQTRPPAMAPRTRSHAVEDDDSSNCMPLSIADMPDAVVEHALGFLAFKHRYVDRPVL